MNVNMLSRHNRCEMDGRCLEVNMNFHRGNEIFPCFAAAFRFINERYTKTFNINYKLHMLKECGGIENNFVLLSKVDMCRLLNSIKQIIPFKFHFSESDAGPNYMTLNMSLEGTGLQHKGLLMLCRMLFEYPHNMCGQDALKLRALGRIGDIDLSKIPLISLYLFCISSMYFSIDECFISVHNPDIPCLEELRNRLKRRTRRVISRVIGSKDYLPQRLAIPTTLEEVVSEEGFEKRLRIYSLNITNNLNA